MQGIIFTGLGILFVIYICYLSFKEDEDKQKSNTHKS